MSDEPDNELTINRVLDAPRAASGEPVRVQTR